MASSFPLASESVNNFSLPQLKRSNAADDTAIPSAGGFHRPSRIVLKFNSEGKKKTHDIVSNVAKKTLIAINYDESAMDETKKAEKKEPTFPTFQVSLGKEKIEADLLAMRGSKMSKRSAARKKKTTTSLQNSFQDDFSSFSTDNCFDSMGSRFNFAVETSENEATSSDGRLKIMWKFSTNRNKKKNEDMATTNTVDQNQTLVSTEFEELEKTETWKNKKKVSEAVNQIITAPAPVHPESTQLGIVPVIKENEEKKKRTFSTFSVSLTKEEIEADFVAMGGSMRTKRVKKRPKNVQRELDNLFPGLLLKYITLDNYKVREVKN